MILLLVAVNVVLVALVVFVRLVNKAHERARKAHIGTGQVIAKSKPRPIEPDMDRGRHLQRQGVPDDQNPYLPKPQPPPIQPVGPPPEWSLNAALQQQNESYAAYKARRSAEAAAPMTAIYGTEAIRPEWQPGNICLDLWSGGSWHFVQSFGSQVAAGKFAREMRSRQNVTLRMRAGSTVLESWQ